MGRRPLLPQELMNGPFTAIQARRSGIDRWHLRGASWRRIGPATYAWAGLNHNLVQRLEAARLRPPESAAFSGLTAAWLHGIDVAAGNPVEVTVPEGAGVSPRSGLLVRRAILDQEDVVILRGLPATSLPRTIADLSIRLELVEALVIVDAALHSRRIRREQLDTWAASRAGRRGVRKLKRVLEHVEAAAESPIETRLRMLLVLGGLPRPRVQVSIYDGAGRFAGRPDLYYEEHRLGIEYDGDIHRGALTADNRRQNKLLNAGVRLLRFTAADVLGNPSGVLAQVRAMLAS